MKNCILAHDLGTSGDKAGLFDAEGRLKAKCYSPYSTFYPKKNWAEQDPNQWWKSFRANTLKVLKIAKVKSNGVACVVMSGQMSGCVPVNRKGCPIRNAIIWSDQRSVKQAQSIGELVDSNFVYNATGQPIGASYLASKILWIKENEPNIFRETYKFLLPKDYIISKLTDSYCTDYSDASATNLFHLREKRWSSEMLDSAKIPLNKLPTPYVSTKKVGNISKKIAEELNLSPNTVIVAGGGDVPCTALGAGVFEDGLWCNYIGSSSWISTTTKEPIRDQRMNILTFCHVLPGLFMPIMVAQSAGTAYEWLRQIIYKEKIITSQTKDSLYFLMEREAAQSGVGADNLIFLPYLMGRRDNPDASGAFVGITLKHRHGDLIRAVIEGITFNLRAFIEAFEAQGFKSKEICLAGGGSSNELWRKIIANIYNKKIIWLYSSEDAALVGAAILGGMAVGLIRDFQKAKEFIRVKEINKPHPCIVKVYMNLYEVYKETYFALIPSFQKLAWRQRAIGQHIE